MIDNENKVTVSEKMLTVTLPPHIRENEGTARVMGCVLLPLLCVVALSTYYYGPRVVIITAISVLSCVLSEWLYQRLTMKKCTVGDLSAVVTGTLLACTLPPSIPVWMPIVGGVFAIVIVKQVFGGIGRNFMNPALAARAFMMLSWPASFNTWPPVHTQLSLFKSMPDLITSATPLASLKAGEQPAEDLLQLFIGERAGSIGETAAVILIAGGLLLLVTRVITWHIPAAYIGTVAAIALIFPRVSYMPLGTYVLTEIMSGGVLLGAIYMATDYSTAPVHPVGKIIFGVGCGALTMFMRYKGSGPESVCFAILVMNCFTWMIDRATAPVRLRDNWTKIKAKFARKGAAR